MSTSQEIAALLHDALVVQTEKLGIWVRSRLWAQVLVALVLGVAVGALLGPDLGWVHPENAAVLGNWLALPGRVFLALISMVLTPLVFTSITLGLNGAGSGSQLRAVGGRLMLFIIGTTAAATAIGVFVTEMIRPGAYLAPVASGAPPEAAAATGGDLGETPIPEVLVRLIPTNPARALLEQDMLAIVVLAIFLGLATLLADDRKVRIYVELNQAVLEISMTVVRWAMFLTPLAVFGLTAQLMVTAGFATLAGLSAYVGTVLLGLLILFLVYLVLVAVVGGMSPVAFLRATGEVLLLAFSTSSSSAVMPLSIETATKKLGVPKAVASIVVPLGATMNMAGTALYQASAVVFLAQMAGMDLPIGPLTAIMATLLLSSIGAPGTPGVSIAILDNVTASFAIPRAGMPLILGVDRPLDMVRTAVNVAGDLTACVVLRRAVVRDPVDRGSRPTAGAPA